VLWDSNHIVVHLHPAPVVAKIAANDRRPDRAEALSRELAVATHLAALGAPAAEPSPELPGRVHWQDGLAMTFWRYYEQDRDVQVACSAIADSLRELHRALRSFPGTLPDFSVRARDPRTIFAKGYSRRLRDRDRDFLVEEHDRLSAELDRLEMHLQPIHGSPHGYNRLTVAGQIMWIDFETACTGPIEADIGFSGCREAFPEADPRSLALFADAASLGTAIACWARMDESPDLAWHAAHHLGVLRSRRLRRQRA
jgi:Ser/Thr protein kinase RdoA (MazF antagonist)